MAPDEKDEPNAFPEAPDLKRVRDLRARLQAEKREVGQDRDRRLTGKVGNAARDLGTYTLIPSLMIAGPVVGYVLGRLVEKWLGGAPWGAVGGMLLGVVAAFREVILLLKRKSGK